MLLKTNRHMPNANKRQEYGLVLGVSGAIASILGPKKKKRCKRLKRNKR